MSTIAEPTVASAGQVATVIRQIRAGATTYQGSGAQYAGFATGRDLAPPLDMDDAREYVALALEIAAISHAGLDPINDLDSLLAVSLLRSVLGAL